MAATNAQLLIFSSFDPLYPTNPRNVQVVEVAFLERAKPGTYADWALREFTDAQLADPSISDPDDDGAPNLLEFVMGGNPWVPDATNFVLDPVPAVNGQFAFQFQQRDGLVGASRQFLSSSNLSSWLPAFPLRVDTIQDSGTISRLEAGFPIQGAHAFYRVQFNQQPCLRTGALI